MKFPGRLCGLWAVMTAIIYMQGCGSSGDKDRGPRPVELPASELALMEPAPEGFTGDVGVLVSQSGQPTPVSALEIANATTRVFSRDETSGALRVSFADLKSVLDIDSVTEDDVNRFPDWLRSLNQTKIRIRGYMYPTFETTGIDAFFLDASSRLMNFGTDPKVYELLSVHLIAGTTTDYVGNGRSVEVIGIFRIDLYFENGRILGLYSLEDAAIVSESKSSK